jgi:predicted transcriptional regulator
VTKTHHAVPKPDPVNLTRRERAIMDILHRRGRATAHEVLADLDDPPSYSAVRTHLRLLEDRGHAKHTQEGITYVYSPTASRTDAKRSALAHIVKTFFAGSVEQAVAALVDPSRAKLSRDELDRLAGLIERAKKEGR